MANPDARIKLLRVIARLNVGGPSIQAITLSRVLEDRGYETHLVRGREGPREGSMDVLADELRVHPHHLPTLKRNLGFGDVLALAFLIRHIRKWKPDILHTHASKAGALGRTAALLSGGARPRVIVHTFHGHVLTGYFPPIVSLLFTAVERILARTTSCLIAVSEEVRRDLVRLRVAPAERIVVVPLGFDLSRFHVLEGERQVRRIAFRKALGIPVDARVVTLVGRVEPVKRVDRFLRVAERLDHLARVHFLIVGDGQLRDELERSREAKRLGERVTWAGLRSDMPDVYFASDVLALTSDNEGTAASAIEAQAARVPVVSTRVGGMPSVVVDGETGVLVDAEKEDEFAAALKRLLIDVALRKKLGDRGAMRARSEFSLDRLVAEIDALYARLLAESANAGMAADDRADGNSDGRAIREALGIVRCIDCLGTLKRTGAVGSHEIDLSAAARTLRCSKCGREYPIVRGSLVMLPSNDRHDPSQDAEALLRRRTAESFAYEWEAFGQLRPEWRENFRNYMRPHHPDWFKGRLVLDVGTGSGRHSFEARRLGARVVAVDIGEAIHVARRNLPHDVVTVQADAENLPFADAAFDLVMAIGVLHHLTDPWRAVKSLARLVRPGGYIQIYVYWIPPRAWHRRVLRYVAAMRILTVKMPYPLLRVLSYGFAGLSFSLFVLPHRIARHVPRLRQFADSLPLKAYVDYPFKVCVNDQFDRFSAPIEWRFTAEEVTRMLSEAGFTDIVVLQNHGWIGSARRPLAAS